MAISETPETEPQREKGRRGAKRNKRKAGRKNRERNREKGAPPWRHIAKGVYYGGGGAYLYQPILKCGCTTMKTLLLELEGLPIDEDLWRRHRKDLNKFPGLEGLSPQEGRDVIEGRTSTFKFTVVRNPYARLASAYQDKIHGKKEGYWNRLIRKSAAARDIPLGDDISFKEFVDVVAQQRVREMDPHWRPQYYAGRFKVIKFDFIGHIEMMASDLAYIVERIGAPPAVIARIGEKYNTTGSSLDMWKTVPDEVRQKYLDSFAVDFDLLHYPRWLPAYDGGGSAATG